LDFETKIVVKHDAPQLFADFLARDAGLPDPIAFSGVTDCFQPAERKFQLTRGCLQVALDCRQPVGIVTKNALIVRDLDILGSMARQQLVHVFVSITTLDTELARRMEPRTSIPEARLRAIDALARAGVPVGVMVAPIIPGLNDSEIPTILAAAKQAGAAAAGYVLLRLPLTVEPVFTEWLRRTEPPKAERVLGRIRQTRSGKANDSTWGRRMTGSGEIAAQIAKVFRVFKRKLQLDSSLPKQDCSRFCPPADRHGQKRLF
ncbi:MAG: radical SAM protein, partial [Pirellulales bacterium]|nr:radical SAM protein [Pirellulales bacterium]